MNPPIELIVIDPLILRQKSRDTTAEEVAQLDLKRRMREAMTKAWVLGTGLAAIQIGVPLRYAFYEFEGKEVELINPRILEMTRKCILPKEGCLSVPDKWIRTMRWQEIVLYNQGITRRIRGVEAIICQHEIDHMEGILLTQRQQNPYPRIGRNERCPCGSGLKYKKCCGRNA